MRKTARRSANRYQRNTPSLARIEKARAQAQGALRRNQCPTCNRPVRRNLALTGWVQCSQFGAPEFRAEPSQPACSWQGFTE
jgi:hypothetical protein